MGDYYGWSQSDRCNHGCDNMSIEADVNWFSKLYGYNEGPTDAVKMMGGNTLGGPTAQPTKWISWVQDYIIASDVQESIPQWNKDKQKEADALGQDYYPVPELSGAAWADVWAERKADSYAKDFSAGVSWILGSLMGAGFDFKGTNYSLRSLGKLMHKHYPVWVAWTAVNALVPIYVNWRFMKKTGAWDGPGYKDND
jgi:hypothetical protein